MAQEKRRSTIQRRLGFTEWDIVRLVLVIVLVLSLIPVRLFKQKILFFLSPSHLPEVALVNPMPSWTSTDTPKSEVTSVTPASNLPLITLSPTPITIIAASAPITVAPSTTEPVTTPTTALPTPTPIGAATVTSTDTPNPGSTHTPNLTSTLAATPSSTLTPSSTFTPSPTLTAVSATVPVAPPASATPSPATVVFVRSKGGSHSLGLVTSAGEIINNELLLHAAAPAASPDGFTIAFYGERGIREVDPIYAEGEGVWTLNLGGGTPHRLFGIDEVQSITWAPDGSRLAFEAKSSAWEAHQIIVINKDGIELARFDGEQPDWTHDSQNLVVKACYQPDDCGLWQVSTQGSFQKRLTDHGTDSFPVLSRDGKYMAFTSNRDGDWEIYLLDLKTLQLERMTERPGEDTTPVFSPDSEWLYIRTSTGTDWRITVMALDGSYKEDVISDIGTSDNWGMLRPAVY
jgi:TolB protein